MNMNRDNEVLVAPILSQNSIIIKQEPTASTEEAEASIPTENVREEGSDDPDLNVTVVVRRKAAKRTSPWDLAAGELTLVSSPPQAEDIPAAKKPRLEEPQLEEPFSASTDEASTKISAHDTTAISLPVNADHVDVDAHPVKGNRATRYWRPEEDEKLKDAVATHGGKNWGAIAALVPGRTSSQCRKRWHSALNPSIALAAGRTGTWTADEDSKLKDAVQTHRGKNWSVIAELVPGRTKMQCNSRWQKLSDPIIASAAGRRGKWTAVEDRKLKDSVQTQGGKDWARIAALVPGRTRIQCINRWKNALNPSIAFAKEAI
jgi:hypothetical protein